MNGPEYRQEPDKRSPMDGAVAVISLALALIFSLLASGFPSFKALGNLLTAALLIFFIQITTRFLLTEITYLYHRDNLFVLSRQGKKEKRLGSLEINEACFLFEKDLWMKEKPRFSLSHKISYCHHFFSPQPCYLLCPEPSGNRFVLLVFEPDETLKTILRNKIERNGAPPLRREET